MLCHETLQNQVGGKTLKLITCKTSISLLSKLVKSKVKNNNQIFIKKLEDYMQNF